MSFLSNQRDHDSRWKVPGNLFLHEISQKKLRAYSRFINVKSFSNKSEIGSERKGEQLYNRLIIENPARFGEARRLVEIQMEETTRRFATQESEWRRLARVLSGKGMTRNLDFAKSRNN